MRLPSSVRSREFGFNMTPMIDVVFLLIIFFLVSSHLAKQESRMPLDLPTAASGSEAIDTPQALVVINVQPDGRLLLAGRTVTPQQLQEPLQNELKRSGEDLELRIRSDRSVPYQHVEPILQAAAKAGIWNVTFAVFETRRGS